MSVNMKFKRHFRGWQVYRIDKNMAYIMGILILKSYNYHILKDNSELPYLPECKMTLI